MPLLLDWRNASQPDDIVRSVVEVLRQGGLAVLPTQSGYLVAANAAHIEAIDRLTGRAAESDDVLSLVVAGSDDLVRWTGPLPLEIERITQRLWPGPLVPIVPLNEKKYPPSSLSAKWAPGGRLRFRCPSDPLVEAVLSTADFPLLTREIRHVTGTEETAVTLAERWGDLLALIVDAGPIAAKTCTEMLWDNARWHIEREGSVTETEIVTAAALWVVFVCTGNTCRSPMADALSKTLLAARFGCPSSELLARGYHITSAGVAAFPGDGPAPEAVEVLRQLGADLSGHRSQSLAPLLVARADHVIAMTRSHLVAVLTRYPVIGGSMRLLCGAEGDLDDPIGGSPEVYAACARTILRHLDRFIMELVRR